MKAKKAQRFDEFKALIAKHNLSTADVAKMLEMNLSVVRAKRAGLRPVTRENLLVMQLLLMRSGSQNSEAA